MFKISENMSQSEKILNAAFKCISTKGYANVSLRDIADEAGVVLSQLNYYYKNKEGLFTQIVKTVSEKYINEVEENLKNGKSQMERISLLIGYFQGLLRNEPELFKLLFDLTSMALWSETLKELLDRLFNNLSELIEKYVVDEFKNEENFKGKSPKALSKIILGTLFGTSIQVILSNEKEELIDSLWEVNLLFQ